MLPPVLETCSSMSAIERVRFRPLVYKEKIADMLSKRLTPETVGATQRDMSPVRLGRAAFSIAIDGRLRLPRTKKATRISHRTADRP